MEKVLVLLATYNGEKYLSEQLNSLFAQENIEVAVLVRDDGSTDKTTEILEKYHAEYNLDWYMGEHMYAPRSYLDLMKKAANTDFHYFAFCDQDDVWDRDKLCVAIEFLKNEDNNLPLLYYCGQKLVDENLNLIEEHRLKKDRTDCARFILNDAAGCTEVFNRHLIEAVIAYNPQYILMHDAWIVKVCLAISGHIIIDCKAHMSYRQHEHNVIGLRRDIRSKLHRAKQYINEQMVEAQMVELNTGFKDRLVDNYKQIIVDVLSYKKSFRSRLRLLNWRKFYFGDFGVQITYVLKIIMNRL